VAGVYADGLIAQAAYEGILLSVGLFSDPISDDIRRKLQVLSGGTSFLQYSARLLCLTVILLI